MREGGEAAAGARSEGGGGCGGEGGGRRRRERREEGGDLGFGGAGAGPRAWEGRCAGDLTRKRDKFFIFPPKGYSRQIG